MDPDERDKTLRLILKNYVINNHGVVPGDLEIDEVATDIELLFSTVAPGPLSNT